MADGDTGLPRKPRARRWWVAAIAVAAALFAGLVMQQMPRPDVAEPPRDVAAKQPSNDQPAKPNAWGEKSVKQPEPPGKPAPEPGPDFDARRFSSELTSAQGAEKWPELYAPGVVPQPFAVAAFRDDFHDLTAAEWHRWLDPVENEAADVSFDVRSGAPFAHLRGMLQLRCPWPHDGVLHLAPFETQKLMLLFWSGTAGVALVHHTQATCAWAAYRIERADESRRPKSFALMATDNGAFHRSTNRSVDVHHQAGHLIVSRGGLRLLTAPLDGVPQAMYVDGDSCFRSFGMDRRIAMLSDSTARRTSVLDTERPADLEWISLPDHAGRGRRLESGAIELSVEEAGHPLRLDKILPGPGLFEIVFELEEASPGSGVQLSDREGRPVYRLAFDRDEDSDLTIFRAQAGESSTTRTAADLQAGPVAWPGRRLWYRLLAGCGVFKCWVGGDGSNWSQPFAPIRGVQGSYAAFGLYCTPRKGPCKIALRTLRICELPALSAMIDADLRKRVDAIADWNSSDYSAWLKRVGQSCPAGVDLRTWRPACAWRTLVSVPVQSLANQVLMAFLDDGLSVTAAPSGQRALFEDAVDLHDSAEPDAARELISRLEKLALQSADRGNSIAFRQWSELFFTLPAWTNMPFDATPISLALGELVPQIDADRYDDIAKDCRKLRFWNQPVDAAESWPDDRLGLKRLIDWAEERNLASRARRNESGDAAQSAPAGRRHPWIVDQGRDAMSPALGLAAAVAESALEEACKLITETPLPSDAGLVPDAKDSHLAVGWPQAIRNTLRDEPRLVTAMQSGHGRRGELRLSRAVAEGDANAVNAASVQFLGTPIAGAARLELGDRNLALGRFSQALAEFQAGRRDASPDQAERLAQRVRLAASLIGLDVGRPARVSVSLNDKSLTSEQFEALLEVRRRRATTGTLLPADQLTSTAATGPPPGRYALQPVVSWVVVAPAKQGEPAAPVGGRACFSAQPDGSICITGALGTTSIALPEQRVRWSHPQIPCRPSRQNAERMASAGDRVFWSRPAAEGTLLTCLDASSGKVKWQKPRATMPVVSNPVWSQRQLFAVAAYPSTKGERRIALCEISPDTGETLLQTDVGGFVTDESGQLDCVLAAAEDRLVLATTAGVLCCNRAGHVHWLQRSTWLPDDIRGLVPDAHAETAIVLQPNAPLIVLQQDVPGLQAFDLETGRRVWQRAIPDLNRIVGSGGGVIVAMTPRGLSAFQAADGAFAWQRELRALPFAGGVCDDGRAFTASVLPDENGKQQLVIQSFAVRDGRDETVASAEFSLPPLSSVACIGSMTGRYFAVCNDDDSSIAWLLELVSTGH